MISHRTSYHIRFQIVLVFFVVVAVLGKAQEHLLAQDFEVPDLFPPPPVGKYYDFNAEKVILTSEADWESDNGGPYGLQIIEANRDGYRYWGYYWVQQRDYFGLARSNDLLNWDKYTNIADDPIPILVRQGIDWPTAGIDGDTIYMIHVEEFGDDDYLVLETSTDGIHFTFSRVIVPQIFGQLNQDPCLFHNPNDGRWYLYWYHHEGGMFRIYVRVADQIQDLDNSPSLEVISRSYTIAAPSMLYVNGIYYLVVETLINGVWAERIYYSSSPTNGFVECSNSPMLEEDIACGIQHAFEGKLYFFVSKRIGPGEFWDIRLMGKKNQLHPKLVFTTIAQTIVKDQVSEIMTVQAQSSDGTPMNVTNNTTLIFHWSSSVDQFSESADSFVPVSSTELGAGTSSVSFYYRDSNVGSPTITVSESPDQGWSDAQQVETVIPAAGLPLFTDVTIASGVMPNPSGTHGVSVADIDGDDDPDIFLNSQEDDKIPPGEYEGNYLFHNNSDGTFTRIDDIAGVQDVASYAHAAIFFDMDNDGDYDLTIGHGLDGLPRRGLFRNDGKGNFTQVDVTAGFEETGDIGTRSIVVGDMNGDGFMDICFSSWSDLDTEYYWGDGTGYFNRHYGLNDPSRAIQGMSMADIDGDGDLDVIMGNFDTNDGIGYYQNNGAGVFNRITGIGLPDIGNGTSANFGDADGDGDLDILVNGPEEGYADLYQNLGGSFSMTQRFPQRTGCVGGCGNDNGAFGDFDNDGDLDLYLPTGIPKIWLNTGNGYYEPVDDETSGIIYGIMDSRFPVMLDYDQDGDLDLFLSQHDGPARLFRNNTDNSQFLRIKLIGPKGDVGGLGTKVWLYEEGHLSEPNHLVMYQEAMASAGYCIQHEPILHFGLGNRSRVDVRAQFINGTITDLEGIEAGQVISVPWTVPYYFLFEGGAWYLISLPVIPADASISTLFPTATAAYRWDFGVLNYVSVSALEPGWGYWLVIPSTWSGTIQGLPLKTFTRHYNPGWYLIGSVIEPVDFSNPNDDPDGSVLTPAYRYDTDLSQYVPADTLVPGQSYWIAVMQECNLTIGEALYD